MPRIALAMMCVLLVLAGGFTYLTPVSAISLDVNPSIELALNRFDRVVSARGLNAEGEALISGISLFGRDYRDAVDAITGSDAMAQYLTDGEQIAITIASDNAQRSADLLEGVNGCAAVARGSACCYALSGELSEQARTAGVSPGRYRMMLELMELDPGVTLEQASALSMSELRARIAELGGVSGESCGVEDCDGSNCSIHGGAANGNQAQNEDMDAALTGANAGNGQGAGTGQNTGNGQGAGTGQNTGNGQGIGNSQNNGNGQGAGNVQNTGNGQGAGNVQNAGNGQGVGHDDDQCSDAVHDVSQGGSSGNGHHAGH
ncbi:MAG TPA: hypothetical protein IAC59_00860 [Candidatus Fimadaptatus faecigallinarum]|uniref:Anti-sigma factor RsgI-like middle domain-containing protein n=1 Tax=Candidatus Fimadaptatus faecigallinarum TaxID=2840814 RepID=A0A9D1LPV3_9FIRM|nr:hypothetical protein [Candidatus Fimadaptatus faecigallinarum]